MSARTKAHPIHIRNIARPDDGPLLGVPIYVGRPSALGNPYVIGPHIPREEVITEYRRWLLEELDHVGEAQHMFRRLQLLHKEFEITLLCWCYPKACHAAVIRSLLRKFA